MNTRLEDTLEELNANNRALLDILEGLAEPEIWYNWTVRSDTPRSGNEESYD